MSVFSLSPQPFGASCLHHNSKVAFTWQSLAMSAIDGDVGDTRRPIELEITAKSIVLAPQATAVRARSPADA